MRAPIPPLKHSGGSITDAFVIALLFGVGCLYFWFFYLRRAREPHERQFRLSIEALHVTRLVDLVPGGLVAVGGRVVDGLRTQAVPIASPWVPAKPVEVHHYIIIDDGSGRTLRIGRGEVGKFFLGDQVFAVGTLEGNVAVDAYRSADVPFCLVRGDGLFWVARGTREEALEQLAEPRVRGFQLDRVVLFLGVLLVLLGGLGIIHAQR